MPNSNRKNVSRLKRARRGRMHIRDLGVHRLTVFRSSRHIYAQVLTSNGAQVLAAASSLEKDFRTAQKTPSKNNVETASKIGTLIAERAIKVGVSKVAFDRSGFKYHGRVKSLADAARAGGLNF